MTGLPVRRVLPSRHRRRVGGRVTGARRITDAAGRCRACGGDTLRAADVGAELAAYVVSGRVAFEGTEAEPGHLLVFRAGEGGEHRSLDGSRLVLLGGAPLDGERFIFWNFVSSSRERLLLAKAAWKLGPQPGTRFPPIPLDDDEFVPLP